MSRLTINRREFITSAAWGLAALGSLPLANKLHGAAGMSHKTGYVYDDRYLNHKQYSGHPETPRRLAAIQEAMRNSGLAHEVVNIGLLTEPLPYIKMVHTKDHIQSLQRYPVTSTVAALAAAGALGAVKAVSEGTVRNAFCAIRPPGHHAGNTGREEGFCYYNNAAIAARYAQEVYGYKKVLIIDWDYHHGNGTEQAFYEDPTVLFFSTHNWKDYPQTGDPKREGAGPGLGYTINVHFDCGATDSDLLAAWEKKLIPKAESFQPDFILISAGFDCRKDDPIGCFKVTDNGIVKMTTLALQMAQMYCQGRLVSLLEGGYNIDGLAKAVTAHVGVMTGA